MLATSQFLLTHCSGEIRGDLQNVLLLVFQLLSFHLPSCSHTPASFHPSSSLSVLLWVCHGVMDLWLPSCVAAGQGRSLLSPASALCLCQSCQRSPLGTKKRTEQQRKREVGTTEQAEGETDRVRDDRLMKEMNRWRRLSRQEMEREMKERRQSACLFCHATVKKGPADTNVCVCVSVFVNVRTFCLPVVPLMWNCLAAVLPYVC